MKRPMSGILFCARIPLSLLLACLLSICFAPAQTEVSPTAAWMAGGSATVPGGKVKYDDGMSYGIILGKRVEKNVNVEFTYSFFSTLGHFEPGPASTATPATLNMTIHYFQFGAAYHALVDNVRPYLATGLGLAWFRPSDDRYKSDVRLALSATTGFEFFPVENFGIRFRGRVLLPIFFSRGGFWGGVNGTGGGFGRGTPIVQADVGGGFVVVF